MTIEVIFPDENIEVNVDDTFAIDFSGGIYPQGLPGHSPALTSERTGSKQTTIYSDGQALATILDGIDGTDGEDGVDGVSPTVTVEDITGGHRVTITDAQGSQTYDVMDGVDGKDGQDGSDGYTPVKGTDYWTAQDKAEMEQDVAEDLIAPLYTQKTYEVGDLCTQNGALYRCKTAIATAEVWTAAHWQNVKIADVTSSLFGDLNEKADKVSGATTGNFASLDANGNLTDSGKKPSDFVTPTDYATSSKAGLVKVSTSDGIGTTSKGSIFIVKADSSIAKNGVNNYKPIVPANQHESVFYGLTKVAGVDMATSNNAVGTYTDSAKVAIQKMLGIYEAPWELIRSDTVTNESSASIDITVDDNGSTFELTDIMLKFWIPSSATGSSKGDYGRVYCYYNQFEADYFYMGGFNSENKIAYGKIEQRKNFLEVTFTRAVTINDETINYGTLRLPTSSNSTMYRIINSTRFYNHIDITDVTGTASYILYGKRRWQ